MLYDGFYLRNGLVFPGLGVFFLPTEVRKKSCVLLMMWFVCVVLFFCTGGLWCVRVEAGPKENQPARGAMGENYECST